MKYTGNLKKPIHRKRLGWLFDEADYVKDAKRIDEELRAKLPDLFKAHGVTDGDWEQLAMALAKAHVPGFRVAKPPGRPNEWDALEAAEFKIDVDNIVRLQGLSVAEAIKQAIRQDTWNSKAKDMTMSALEKRYYGAIDSKWLEIAKKNASPL